MQPGQANAICSYLKALERTQRLDSDLVDVQVGRFRRQLNMSSLAHTEAMDIVKTLTDTEHLLGPRLESLVCSSSQSPSQNSNNITDAVEEVD